MVLNLVQHRAEPNVWDRVGRQREWDTERWLAALAAGACFAAGVRHRSVGGLLLVLGGSTLAWWGASAPVSRDQWRGRVRKAIRHRQRHHADVVGEASKESFPASDPPAWTRTTGSASTCEGTVPVTRT